MLPTARYGRRRPGRKSRDQRVLTTERLESRLLLAALEGSEFSLPAQTLDTVGLVGTVSAKIRWGDGSSETTVPVSTPSVPNKIRFKFDYSLDTRGFFTSARRTVLEQVGRSVTQYFTDTLSAITPSGQNTWTANTCHPSQGASNQLCGGYVDVSNRVRNVAANEIVVFAGARDIIGDVRGTGSFGGYTAVGTQAWLDNIAGRGQSGALRNPQTDFAPWGGSISFDNSGTDWYFEKNLDGIKPEQVDFRTVAAHELLHLLGFGQRPPDKTSPWENLTRGTTFNGNAARNAYIGNGYPPVDTHAHGDGPAKTHWDESIEEAGQLTLMRAIIETGTGQTLTRLDLAAMDDIGWQVDYPERVNVQANHVYADNGTYAVEVILRGSVSGQINKTIQVDIGNVSPQLTVPETQTVVAGETLTLGESLFEIVDPGYGSETFDYTIDWNDGSPTETGQARITQSGNATRDTLATLSASHTYTETGNFRVRVTVTDDDGGSVSKEFTAEVTNPPALSLSLSRSSIVEDEGAQAATLTITRSGPAKQTDQTITLQSNDETEATVPETVVIKAGDTSATAAVRAIDDLLLDGTQTVILSASATGAEPDDIELTVQDAEYLEAELSAEGVAEDDNTSVLLRIRRRNTDNGDPLQVNVSGGNPNELEMPQSVTIEPDRAVFIIRLAPINDDDPEWTELLTYTFQASGYQGTSITFPLWDDEHPLFQNPDDRFDVNGRNGVTSNDALRVINELGRRQGKQDLDPESEQPEGVFVDVTGDYKVTGLDALQVINEIATRLLSGEPEMIPENNPPAELIAQRAALALLWVSPAATLDDDDTLDLLALDAGRIF